MGVSPNVLSRIVTLSDNGYLPAGTSVLELGTQQLHCKGAETFLAEFVSRISAKNPALKNSPGISAAELEQLSRGGFLLKLLKACGYQYTALDIFDAEDTILFDLNRQEPPAAMRNRYDLVTNFGTTEHIVNQYLAFKTVHELTKVGGIMFHELPLSGFHSHGFFSYNPLLFNQLAEANGYEVLHQAYSKNDRSFVRAPDYMRENGYPDDGYFDYGIQFVLRKTSDTAFRIPLETSTSLDVSPIFLNNLEGDWSVKYGLAGLKDLSRHTGMELQRELFKRYKRRLCRMVGLRT